MGVAAALAAEMGEAVITVSMICLGTTVTEIGGQRPKRQLGVKVRS